MKNLYLLLFVLLYQISFAQNDLLYQIEPIISENKFVSRVGIQNDKYIVITEGTILSPEFLLAIYDKNSLKRVKSIKTKLHIKPSKQPEFRIVVLNNEFYLFQVYPNLLKNGTQIYRTKIDVENGTSGTAELVYESQVKYNSFVEFRNFEDKYFAIIGKPQENSFSPANTTLNVITFTQEAELVKEQKITFSAPYSKLNFRDYNVDHNGNVQIL